MRRLFTTILLLGCLSSQVQAGTYCVGPSSSGNASGSDWNNCKSWTSSPSSGDVWYIKTGSYAAKTFSVTITVYRATTGDHFTDTGWTGALDDVATIASPLAVNGNNSTIDGKTFVVSSSHKAGITLSGGSTTGGCPGCGTLRIAGTSSEVRNVYMSMSYDNSFGHGAILAGANSGLSNVWIKGSAYEDHANVTTTSGTNYFVRCIFDATGHPSDGAHRDCINPYTTGGFGLLVKNCIIIGNDGDGFLIQTTSKLKTIVFEGNIWNCNINRCLGFGSGASGADILYLRNNIVRQVSNWVTGSGTGPDSTVERNNFFGGGGDGDPASGSPQYCLWQTGTSGYVAGTGNVNNVTPSFTDSSSTYGADGLPFTTDDGFSILTGSPLKNAGVDVGRTTDILGGTITDTPDVGPYEFGATQGGDSTAPTLSNVSSGSPGNTTATITYDASETCTNFWVTYSVNANLSSSSSATNNTDGASTSIGLSGLSAGTTYYYSAYAVDGSNNTGQSSTNSFATTTPPAITLLSVGSQARVRQ